MWTRIMIYMQKNNTKMTCILFLMICIFVSSFIQSEALSISTNKKDYYFGDHLTFIVQVEKVEESFASLWIIDSNDKKSSTINIPITETVMNFTSPFPFESETYPKDTYVLLIEYSGNNATTQFNIKDSGKIRIPIWIKDVAKLWIQDIITDEQFLTTVKSLTEGENSIIMVPEKLNSLTTQSKIPQWMKTNTEWWINDLTDDKTYVITLQYLIKIGVIVV